MHFTLWPGKFPQKYVWTNIEGYGYGWVSMGEYGCGWVRYGTWIHGGKENKAKEAYVGAQHRTAHPPQPPLRRLTLASPRACSSTANTDVDGDLHVD